MQSSADRGDGIAYCSLDTLLNQRIPAQQLRRGRKNIHARQTGNHLSTYKGHGMAFAESRPYQAGDDVRLLDWRVTARTGKAYTKLFEEEKEYPVILWIDLRAPMFFATRGCYKSVLAATIASLLLWKGWLDGDRVGAVLVDAQGGIQRFPASRHLSALSRLLQALADATQLQRNVSIHSSTLPMSNMPLIDAVEPLNNIISRGGELILVSDFRGLTPQVEQHLQSIKRRCSLVLVTISDPFEQQLPVRKSPLRMGYKGRFLTLGLQDPQQLHAYYAQWQQRQQKLKQLSQQFNLPLIKLSTADTALEQLLKLVQGLR